MGLLDKLFGRRSNDDDGFDVPITLDVEQRTLQLAQLEKALDALANAMRETQSTDNPGWRVRVNEYNRLAGDAAELRRSGLTREALLDLAFEVRPLFVGPVPEGFEVLVPLQDAVMARADEIRTVLPGER